MKGPDLAAGAVTSPTVANGSLLGEDFAAGQLPQGPQGQQGSAGTQGVQGIQGVPGNQGVQGPAGSARAWGLVGSSGSVQRGFGVIGDAGTPEIGVYCLTLSPSIDLDSSIVLTGADLDTNGTNPPTADKSLSEWSSDRGPSPCPTTQVTIRTYLYNGDSTDDNAGGDTMLPDNDSFTFMVP